MVAVDSVDFTVHSGEIVGLIGPNGAGKTTFQLPHRHVQAHLGRGPVRRPGAAAQAPQGGAGRHGPDVPEHPAVPQHDRAGERHGGPLLPHVVPGAHLDLRGPKFRREEAETRERAIELLAYVGMKGQGHLARNLPYGDQRRLEIARALATDPKLLLLDEPTAGMNPQETRQAEELIFKIRDSGLAIVVIEHDMRFIFNLCDRVQCWCGARRWSRDGNEVQSDPRVIEAYIGSPEQDAEADNA
ncbi:MAG: ATP-binding cassette domain-containing protein [Micropruina sp.]